MIPIFRNSAERSSSAADVANELALDDREGLIDDREGIVDDREGIVDDREVLGV